MGLLDFEGEPLAWNEIKPYVEHVKKHGMIQFVNNYKRLMKRPGDILKWGDEVEYMIIRFDHENKKVQLSLRGEEICNKLQERENNGDKDLTSLWRQEYASYMVEGTPGVPYFGYMAQFNVVEANMKMRRKEVQELLRPDEEIMSLTVFPRLGCFNFTHPSYLLEGPESNPVSRSLFFPDQAISSHPRFPYLTRNIKERRGEKVVINIPIFKDTNTPSPFIEKFNDPESDAATKPDHIYMDCMGFGMGNCCLQLTFQACNINEAKLLYDQLAPVCPIMLALSAAAPIYKGYLSDIDARWQVIAHSVDDRTRDERGLGSKTSMTIRKSRYDSIDSYLESNSKVFNDIDLEINEEAKSVLLEAGVDELLAQHIGHLWIRDPLTLFSKRINLDDDVTTEHFEREIVRHQQRQLSRFDSRFALPGYVINIQSTNWQSMRFKPPPPGSPIGWRVEFRVCEAQLTDFENAAFVVFIVLLTRVILTYKIDFLMPVSCVDKNMIRAQKNNAAIKEKFYFRQNVITSNTPACCVQLCSASSERDRLPNGSPCTADNLDVSNDACCREMSIDTIINGKADVFPGFIPLIRRYLDSVEVGVQARCSISEYLNLISKRASGEYMTAAQWMRHFVRTHPDYKNDSVVTDSIAYDLLVRCNQIEKGEVKCHQLFGSPKHKSEYVAPINVDTLSNHPDD